MVPVTTLELAIFALKPSLFFTNFRVPSAVTKFMILQQNSVQTISLLYLLQLQYVDYHWSCWSAGVNLGRSPMAVAYTLKTSIASRRAC